MSQTVKICLVFKIEKSYFYSLLSCISFPLALDFILLFYLASVFPQLSHLLFSPL